MFDKRFKEIKNDNITWYWRLYQTSKEKWGSVPALVFKVQLLIVAHHLHYSHNSCAMKQYGVYIFSGISGIKTFKRYKDFEDYFGNVMYKCECC